MLRFIDKTTGENLITSNRINPLDISVTNKKNNEAFKEWGLLRGGVYPRIDILSFSFFLYAEGEFSYEIKLSNDKKVTLSFIVTKKQSDDPCKSYYYAMSDLKTTDHPFWILELNGIKDPNYLVVEM